MTHGKPTHDKPTHGKPELWLICGSQHLYGPEVLDQVRANAQEVARNLDKAPAVPLPVRLGALVTTPEEVRQVCLQANSDPSCAGVILWMHTFSPSRMWIGGLSVLAKPICHLHTQYNRDLPFDEIDMDFMNLNQAAHGDREAGHLHSRMRLERKVVVGHWSDPEVQERLGAWARAVHGWFDLQGAKFARFGDNMRYVAVTEGDKVGAELKFGISVNGYGIGDLVERVDAVSKQEVDGLVEEYQERYDVAEPLRPSGERHESLRDGARIELGMRAFLTDGGFKGFTTTFENLTGLKQLPGLAVQRLMADGYGFGAEGDWKTAAILRAMKVMADGLPGGTSFMEDYTYDLNPAGHRVLAAHMLEICESIADGKPALEIHSLGIGGKEDPVRLIFNAPAGPAINVSLVDLGNRFRLLVNDVEAVDPPPLPKLPVARALWEVQPDFKTGIAAWILAGGAHHTAFSYALTSEHIQDFAAIADVELAVIDADTRIRDFKRELRQNDLAYAFSRALSG